MTSTLGDELDIDLFEFIEVISDLSDEFLLTIPSDLEFNAVTVGDVVREVRRTNKEVAFAQRDCFSAADDGRTIGATMKQWLSRLFLRAQRFSR